MGVGPLGVLGRSKNLAMRFVKRSTRKSPRVSLVLLDWSVRESFHLLHYLDQQTANRDDFEVIIIEYYSRISPALKQFEDQVDTWLVLDSPENCYYHKHLMYNAGIVVANGDIIMIGDSDAMVKPTFIEAIIKAFDRDRRIVYHLDQFRNLRHDFYPFNYPSFEDVLGAGCINNVGGKTAGVLNTEDPIHSRNYGACMCAKREYLIAIGGADMHIDYLGHICGPYDMTFRLVNYGLRECWDQDEFTYHTWHPGQAGTDNYLGPHDGRHMSTTSLEAITSGRIRPLDENEAIRLVRTDSACDADEALEKLVPPNIEQNWDLKFVESNASHLRFSNYRVPLGMFRGYRLVSELGRVCAYPLTDQRDEIDSAPTSPSYEGDSEDEVKGLIAPRTPARFWVGVYVLPFALFGFIDRQAQRLPLQISRGGKTLLGLLGAPVLLLLGMLFFPAPLIGRMRVLRRNSQSATEGLSDLAATFVNLSGSGVFKDENELPVFMADRRRLAWFVRILRILGSAPPMIVEQAGDIERVQAVLAKLEAKRWSGLFLIPSEPFRRFHSSIGPATVAQRRIVV